MSRTAYLATAMASVLLAVGTVPAAAGAATDAEIEASVRDGASWIESQQAADGTFNPGFSSFDPTPTALAAAGRNAADVAKNGGPSLQEALWTVLSNPGSSAHPTNAAAFENAILSAYAAGIDPSRVSAGENLAADLGSTYLNGYFGDSTSLNNVVFGALALNRVQAPSFLLDRTVAVIRANQHLDGGWNYGRAVTPGDQATPSDVDLTGASMAALCDSGVAGSDAAVQDALDFLKSKFDPATGGFDSFGSSNASTNGWVVSGLNACGIDPQGPEFNANQTPIDYLLGLQDADGAFEFSDPPNPYVDDGPNLPSSRDALRAVAGASFSAAPPARSNPALPPLHPVPTVAGGTAVPIALAVDDGSGGITFCRVTVSSGATLEELLSAANTSSAPAACATGAAFTNGELSTLNGQTGEWEFSANGGAEQAAAGQTVRFGDFVALRRSDGGPTVPDDDEDGDGEDEDEDDGGFGSTTAGGADTTAGGPTGAPGPVSAVEQTTLPAGVASRSLKVSLRKRQIAVSIRCAKANGLCEGTVRLVYRTRTLGRRSFLIRGGRTTRLNVKLSKRAMKRLGRSRKRVVVDVFSRDGFGIGSRSTRTVTVTPTK